MVLVEAMVSATCWLSANSILTIRRFYPSADAGQPEDDNGAILGLCALTIDARARRDPAAVWFSRFSSDRKGIHPANASRQLAKGILQADAYAGFDKLYASGDVHEAACWDHGEDGTCDDAAHVRTRLRIPRKLLEMIGELYSIEADIRGKAPDERLRVRQEKSKPLLVKFETTIRAKLATLSTKSALTAAINYSLNHWAALTFYCEDGRAEISNDARRKRPALCSLGQEELPVRRLRKWRGERAAAMYSLIRDDASSTASIRVLYLEYECLLTSLTTRSTASTSCCHGTSPSRTEAGHSARTHRLTG